MVMSLLSNIDKLRTLVRGNKFTRPQLEALEEQVSLLMSEVQAGLFEHEHPMLAKIRRDGKQ